MQDFAEVRRDSFFVSIVPDQVEPVVVLILYHRTISATMPGEKKIV